MIQLETKAKAHADYKSSLGYNYNECKSSFVDGAEWMQKKMIDKACEILENVTVTYNKRFFGKCEENAFDADFINEFRQAMEE